MHALPSCETRGSCRPLADPLTPDQVDSRTSSDPDVLRTVLLACRPNRWSHDGTGRSAAVARALDVPGLRVHRRGPESRRAPPCTAVAVPRQLRAASLARGLSRPGARAQLWCRA